MDVTTDNSEFYTLEETRCRLMYPFQGFEYIYNKYHTTARRRPARLDVIRIIKKIKEAETLEDFANLNVNDDNSLSSKVTSFSIAVFTNDVKLFKTLLYYCKDKSLINGQWIFGNGECILFRLLRMHLRVNHEYNKFENEIFNLILSNLDNLKDAIKDIVDNMLEYHITPAETLKLILNNSNFQMLNRFSENNLNEFEDLFEENPEMRGIVENLIEFTLIVKNQFRINSLPVEIFGIIEEYYDNGIDHINTYALDIHSDIRAQNMSDEEIIEKIKQKLEFKREFIDLQDFDGNTWLHLALINDRKELIKFLQDKGASQDIENLQSETAVQLSMNRELIEESWSYTDIIMLSMLFVIGLISILAIMSHIPCLFAAL